MNDPTSNERLARSDEYLGKDRDELREIILDRDEAIASHERSAAEAWAKYRELKSEMRQVETSDKPVAWRYLADSAYEQRPRWVYFEENTPTVRLVAEGRTLEPLYSRGSPLEPIEPATEALLADRDRLIEVNRIALDAATRQAQVVPSVCGKPMPDGKGAGQCINVLGHEGECDDMPF